MTTPTLRLAPGKEKALWRHHPWVFSGALWRQQTLPEEGEWVDVTDADGKPVATAHMQNPKASILLKVLSFGDPVKDKKAFYEQRISAAVQYRQSWGLGADKKTTGYRVVFGEGDGLPGLIVDRFDEILVVQCHTRGMLNDLPFISEALLLALPKTKGIYSKSAESFKPLDKTTPGLPVENGWIQGKAGKNAGHFMENGIPFTADFEGGQKTGFFLDQRDNRALVGKHSSGKNVLNVFSYTGGFSMAALANGAARVVSVDSSARACARAEEHAALLGASDKHTVVISDAFDYLQNMDDSWDVVILDPPAFAKRKTASHNAMMAYKRLNALALSKMKSGSFLFTFSCSQNVPSSQFLDALRAAAFETGKSLKIVKTLGQPVDHPVVTGFPEGEYLKGLLLYIE